MHDDEVIAGNSDEAEMMFCPPKSLPLRQLFHQSLYAFLIIIGVSVEVGWQLGERPLMGVLGGAVPMSPLTAVLLQLAAIGALFSGTSAARAWRKVGIACLVVVLLVAAIRGAFHMLSLATPIDQILFPNSVQRLSAEYPVPIQVAPATCSNFLLIGMAILCLYVRRNWLRFPAFLLLLLAALISLSTLGKCALVNLETFTTDSHRFPMAPITAIGFLLLVSAVAADLSGMEWQLSNGERKLSPEKTARSSLGNQITVGMAASVFMLCAIGVFSYQSMARFVEDTHWDDHTYKLLAAIDSLDARFKDAQSAGRGYVITGDPAFLNFCQIALPAINDAVRNIQRLSEENRFHLQQIDQLKALASQNGIVIQQMLDLRSRKDFDLASEASLTASSADIMNQIHQVLTAMTAEENDLLRRRMADTEANAWRSIYLVCFGALLALVIVLAIGKMLNHSIGQRERIEMALRASESLFRGLLHSAPDAMVITDRAGRIELCNRQAELLFGYSAEYLAGEAIDLLVPGLYTDAHLDREDAGLSSPVIMGNEPDRPMAAVREDSTEVPVEISLSPIVCDDGARFCCAIRDITRRRRDELAMADLNFALRASNIQQAVANKELESFSYSVSHDLRAPLRSIDGFSRALEEDYADKLDAQGLQHLQRVRDASRRMEQLIDGLLDLSRVTRAELRREDVNLSKLTLELVEELRPSAADRNVEFIVADGLSAKTDPRLIRVVMTNLLNNAVKFTAKRPAARIEVGAIETNGASEYFVRDNGAGFDPAYSDKLFGTFQRLHAQSEFAGNGIGLATVKRIIVRHGGHIWAEGAPDRGATFHFTL